MFKGENKLGFQIKVLNIESDKYNLESETNRHNGSLTRAAYFSQHNVRSQSRQYYEVFLIRNIKRQS